MKSLILAAAFAAGAAAQEPVLQGGLLGLNCIEALAAAGQPKLAGVFSFVPEKDSSAAFADFVANDSRLFKKYLEKVERDFKAAGGITVWDHEVLMFALSLYSGPLAPALDKPSGKVLERVQFLSAAPTLSLEDVTARRKK